MSFPKSTLYALWLEDVHAIFRIPQGQTFCPATPPVSPGTGLLSCSPGTGFLSGSCDCLAPDPLPQITCRIHHLGERITPAPHLLPNLTRTTMHTHPQPPPRLQPFQLPTPFLPIGTLALGVLLAFAPFTTFSAPSTPPDAPSSKHPHVEILFNGKDLSGWQGKPGEWYVEDGAITSQSTEAHPCLKHHYLVWTGGQPADFDLDFEYRVVGGNSGVQFRSRILPDWDMSGYQADIEAGPEWTGALFEHQRGGIALRGQKVIIAPSGHRSVTNFAHPADLLQVIRSNDWNHYRILARGPEIQLFINNTLTAHAIDHQTNQAAAQGHIGLQMHPGPPMKVQFRNLRLRHLPPAQPTAPVPSPFNGDAANNTSSSHLLPVIWPEHPRLIATQTDWQSLPYNAARDPDLRSFIDGILREARKSLDAPTPLRQMEGRRLLGVSRETLRRILLTAFAYRYTGEPAFLDRARIDLLAVARFEDWNPSHFLDVAEMATGVALGYDWLYHDLTPDERQELRNALVTKALLHAQQGHPSFRSHNNWNQVCIGGLVLAALAIGDEEPELTETVLTTARTHTDRGLAAYQPHGIYPEGPSYWEYGTTYTVLLIAALRSVTSDDWNLPNAPGLLASLPWIVHMTGPTGTFYNFADSGTRAGLSPAQFFLSRELRQPSLLHFQRREARRFAVRGGSERFAPLVAFWWPQPEHPITPLPRHWSGSGLQPVAAWRTDWEDPHSLYVAIKGGGARANHAHMDGGSFVLEAGGVRWAEDLGLQSYHSLESAGVQLWAMHQDSPRWSVFRLGPFAHNTLTLNDQLHDASGMATFTDIHPRGAHLDLTPIFLPGQVTSATRSISIRSRRVLLEDNLIGAAPGASLRWAMTTRADILLDGHRATLRLGDQSMLVRIQGALPEILDISAPVRPFDAPNPGYRLLVARAQADIHGAARIRVHLGPVEAKVSRN